MDIRAIVTDKIVEALKAGVAPWVRPWKTTGAGLPVNGKSKRAYSGINVMLLWWEQNLKGYPTAEWYTFKGAGELGGQVRKGEHGTLVIFWKLLDKSEADPITGQTRNKKVPLLRYYNVFNRAQIDGLPELPVVEAAPFDVNERAAGIIAGTGAKIVSGGDEACYLPLTDTIRLPLAYNFESPDAYYATTFHELAHWTGAKSRLDRLPERIHFGTPEYAGEELVAEIASAFLCAEMGFSGKLQHPEYIGHWIKKLQDDSNAIFSANSKASKAADFILKSGSAEEADAVEAE